MTSIIANIPGWKRPRRSGQGPAEDSERAPDVVVDKVNGPEPTVSNKPPVLGPVMDLAVVPEKVILPPEVNMPARS